MVPSYNPDPSGRVLTEALAEFQAREVYALRQAGTSRLSGGVYALYYQGPHPLYRQISSPQPLAPIYVGKSDNSVSGRLRSHRKSIRAVFNLEEEHFTYRTLTLPSEWAVLIEALFHRHFDPYWIRSAFNGFGNNDPGSKRGGKASNWDVLHPGRSWALGKDREGEAAVLLEAERDRWRQENRDLIFDMFGDVPPDLGAHND